VEQPKLEELIKLLEDQGKDPFDVCDVLCSIIKQQMLSGGSLEDKIYFQIEKAKSKRRL